MIECFFFIEKDNENDEEGIVRSLCIDCKMKNPSFPAWFYSGEVGPWTLVCRKCNTIISLHDESLEKNEITNTH